MNPHDNTRGAGMQPGVPPSTAFPSHSYRFARHGRRLVVLVVILALLCDLPAQGQGIVGAIAPDSLALPPEVPAPGDATDVFGRMWQRDVFVRRYRLRRTREFLQRRAEVVVYGGVAPVGAPFTTFNLHRMPKSRPYETGVRRSKRKKKCNNENDSSCDSDLAQNDDCRWTQTEMGDYLVGTNFVYDDQLCSDIHVGLGFGEMDRPIIADVVNALTAPIACLGTIFSNPGAGALQRVGQFADCQFNATVGILTLPNKIFTSPLTTMWRLGEMETGTHGTPHLLTPTLNPPSNEQCAWVDVSGDTDNGDLQETLFGSTAQVELTTRVTQLGHVAATGNVNVCACGDSVPKTELTMAGFSFYQKNSCELYFDMYTRNENLNDPNHVGTRRFEICLDVAPGGDTVYPRCGADYVVVMSLDSDGTDLMATRGMERWDGSAWVAATSLPYEAKVDPCHLGLTANLMDVGNPAGNVSAWCVVRNQFAAILDVMPAPTCSPALTIPITSETVCPVVVSIDKTDAEAGVALAPLTIGFSEPIHIAAGTPVMISPPVSVSTAVNWNGRYLTITPDAAWVPGRYTVALLSAIQDCAGNALTKDGYACGTPVTFPLCISDGNLVLRNGSGVQTATFKLGEGLFLTGTNQSSVPGGSLAYVTDTDVLEHPGEKLIDQTSDGPNAITPVSGVIPSTGLGSCAKPGEYSVVIDVNGNGTFQAGIDRTTNPCYPALTVAEYCEEFSSGVGASAYWALNENYAGSGAMDAENLNDGAYVGSPTSVAGKVGRGLSFDGTNYVAVPNSEDLEVGDGDFGISAWVRPTDTIGIRSIVDMRNASGRGYHLAIVAGKLVLQLANAAGFSNFGSVAAVPVGQWTHVAASVDRSAPNLLKLYINGKLDSVHDGTVRSGDLTSGADFWIGGHGSSATSHFRGAIDELALWDEPPTDLDVFRMAYAGSAGRPCYDGRRGDDSGPAPPDPGTPDLPVEKHVFLASVENPIRQGSLVSFTLPMDMPVHLVIYDGAGRRVRTLLSGPCGAGTRVEKWDGRDDDGARTGAGVYFVRLETPFGADTRKVVRLR